MVPMLIQEIKMILPQFTGLHRKVNKLIELPNIFTKFLKFIMPTFDSGYVEITKMLIDYGAGVNARRRDKWTPLHLAAHHGN